jgi:hypothetical protein
MNKNDKAPAAAPIPLVKVITARCATGCDEEVVLGVNAVALPGGTYCAYCGGEKAVGILDDQGSTRGDRALAEIAITAIRMWQKLAMRPYPKVEGEKP